MTPLARLRAELARRHLAGFVIPISDEHMSEYVGAYAQRLAFLTGFLGSAGSAAVTQRDAAMFVDGRYTLQVRTQVDGGLYEYRSVPAEPLIPWLAAHAHPGDRIGFDPWLHTRPWASEARAALAAVGATLVAVESNPIDAIWPDQPAPSTAPILVHDTLFAGETSAAKRAALAQTLRSLGADATVIAPLDSVAWLFNIRGSDVARTPVPRAFALLRADATATLFTDPAKLTPEVLAHLGPEVATAPYTALADALRSLAGQTVAADPATCVAAIFGALEGATILETRDLCALPKARKNPTEIEGTRAAHVRDGLALTRFLHWFDREAPNGQLDELIAQDKLESVRRESNLLKDLSFDSISAFGPNGAGPHYKSSPASNRRIAGDSLYLIDSGGQYPDGTTDVTRTLAVGSPSAEMRDRFTRVLKGHIALATARFPRGTRGIQLDTFARQFLWAAGLDYAHGTGHGVGSFLAVHEGPARIASAPGANGIDEPLAPGMILSNEPGFYQDGDYGIRIENLVLVTDHGDGTLGFETLTLAPIDTRLIDLSLMTDAELAWLNAYHARVADTHLPHLDPDAAQWLRAATAPLARPLARAA
ncbi:aminopeptidase P family protein [Sandaracinobacteroides saxicola]|uniref:Aminopeptidase P family protein n=1 Tax=Sandaracinobacteroides saxicola TaxID=2759707 RepID=A0A7G5IH49_9SPHN|nr:aminopeptidase P family protein [Sandaracinobacteroides saxicola]QMW22691.1 aminopeptidase P family protein [Sandaracinobacteroides saxicola]